MHGKVHKQALKSLRHWVTAATEDAIVRLWSGQHSQLINTKLPSRICNLTQIKRHTAALKPDFAGRGKPWALICNYKLVHLGELCLFWFIFVHSIVNCVL